jgi:hypothetical protein
MSRAHTLHLEKRPEMDPEQNVDDAVGVLDKTWMRV